MNLTQVILVDENDHSLGSCEKMEAHQKGLLHRAFSVFIFNSKGEMLLQQRALHKYHSAGLWTNACCSHPAYGEATPDAVHRRLKEELGIDTAVEKLFEFRYKASFGNGLTEHEFDHVYAGRFDGEIHVNPDEVMDCCYRSIAEIIHSLEASPQLYTAWFQLAFPKIRDWWQQQPQNRE
ncbi:MAG: isopentenyl-diphosphate Delta-isomerase [Sphingobacteriales bacterium]|nr:isopentenyl-diphosphate Delta-isomerase [Sphingobacteriales bacterium]